MSRQTFTRQKLGLPDISFFLKKDALKVPLSLKGLGIVKHNCTRHVFFLITELPVLGN